MSGSRFNRPVHISVPVARIVEKARGARRPIAVAFACGGSAQIIPAAPRPIEGQIDDIVLADTRSVPRVSDHVPNSLARPSDTPNGIAKENQGVGKTSQGLGRNRQGPGNDQ